MNAETAKGNRSTHRISMQGREALEVHGVTDVISFDEQSVVLSTLCGNMEVDGASLHIHVLSMEEGIVTMDGKVNSISYYDADETEKSPRGGFFGKLFR